MERAFAINEYKKEAFGMFEDMLERMRRMVTLALSHVEMRSPEEQQAAEQQEASAKAASAKAVPASAVKVGRNDACPCGSGKKYKHCHGAI